MEKTLGGGYSKQLAVDSDVGMSRGTGYYTPRLRATIICAGGISRIDGWRLQDLGVDRRGCQSLESFGRRCFGGTAAHGRMMS